MKIFKVTPEEPPMHEMLKEAKPAKDVKHEWPKKQYNMRNFRIPRREQGTQQLAARVYVPADQKVKWIDFIFDDKRETFEVRIVSKTCTNKSYSKK